jgi:D-glycero-D-manno-heptose 1,7-bisphosphate phosphatase
MSKALFIDRDGVINREKDYVHKIENFEFVDGIFEALREFISKGFLIIVITNQAGIARGLYSEKDFEELTEWMIKQFESEGVKITDVFFDPTHPEYGKGSYKKESYYRKPNPGMILQAAEKYKTDLEKSILVGDKPSDAEAGKRAGVGSLFLVRTGHQFMEKDVPPDCVVVDELKDVLKNLD